MLLAIQAGSGTAAAALLPRLIELGRHRGGVGGRP